MDYSYISSSAIKLVPIEVSEGGTFIVNGYTVEFFLMASRNPSKAANS
jgi:hypothetical protein